MTREEAEKVLTEWARVTWDRDNRVRPAVAAGVTRYRVQQLTGLGKSTIIRILRSAPDGPLTAQEGNEQR